MRSQGAQALRRMAEQSTLTAHARACPFVATAMTAKRSHSSVPGDDSLGDVQVPNEAATEAARTGTVSKTPGRGYATAAAVKSPKTFEAPRPIIPSPAPARPTAGYPASAPDYSGFFNDQLSKKRSDKLYRFFNNVNRLAAEFPRAHLTDEADKVTVWCANDYLGMGRNPVTLEAMRRALETYGAGAGGTRNIAGHNRHAIALEAELAALHKHEASLVFSLCYVANDAVLLLFGQRMPDLVIFSDELNHALMIQGIRNLRARKEIFKHNCVEDLERRLAQYPLSTPKIIAFESVYSMCGLVAPIRAFCDLAKKYGALTFLDEVHAVGMYGPHGAGVAEHLDFEAHLEAGLAQVPRSVMAQVDMVTGTLGKAYGVVGGYVTGRAELVDWLRLYAPGFIFTTSLPPAVMAGAAALIRHQRQHVGDRVAQQLNTRTVKRRLAALGVPVIPNPSHIVPVLVGNAADAKRALDVLLAKHGVYVQAINFPTVPIGEERLRITPTPGHTAEHVDQLVAAVDSVFTELGLRREADWAKVGGLCGVGDGLTVAHVWTDEQLALTNSDLNPNVVNPDIAPVAVSSGTKSE